jgi:2-oxoisovalerate ferredoxin oxidoreductase alpha subunit
VAVRLIKGNEAVVVGALHAGCDCFFGYPITPASEIAHAAAAWFPRAGRVFLQAECETAAINMLYGAACAGHRAMTGSSGPGISLMQEGFSYLAGAELPCVIVDIMRAGPGLGNIFPEQSDYNQVVKGGGHGAYRNLVLAPASVQEMCDLTMTAFDLAFRYRNPAVVLADGMLGQIMEPLRLPERQRPPPDVAAWAVQGTAATRGNLLTSIYLDPDELETLNQRLQDKYALAAQREAQAELYRAEDAEVLLVAYGIASRVARTAVDHCRAAGIRAGLFRPITLFPLAVAELNRLPARRIEVVELSEGQFRDDVRLAVHDRVPVGLVARMGGHLVSVEQILEAARGGAPGREAGT